MVLLVLVCQTLVYREVTALFSLKTPAATESYDDRSQGKDAWSKTLNWYFFAVTNYFLYGESIIYYFKVRFLYSYLAYITDASGSMSYLQTLSFSRSQQTIAYLVLLYTL